MAREVQINEVGQNVNHPAEAANEWLSLPKIPPQTPEVVALRQEGVHVHHVSFDSAADERERLSTVRALGLLSATPRARMWYWTACTIADWYGGTQEVSVADLRADLDLQGEFPRWEDFERETLQKPLEALHAHADFRVKYHTSRRGGKVVAIQFALTPRDLPS